MEDRNIFSNYSQMTSSEELLSESSLKRIADYTKNEILVFFKSFGITESAYIYEFGAGTGKNGIVLKRLGYSNYIGTDISCDQVALAKKNLVNVLPIDALSSNSFRSDYHEAFDVILAMDVLEHLEMTQIQRFAEMIKCVLRPGGVLIIQVPNSLAPISPIVSGDLTHLRFFTAESVCQVYKLCGLELNKIKGCEFPGNGVSKFFRGLLKYIIIYPALTFVFKIMYGFKCRPVIFSPNLLAIGSSNENK